MNLEEARKALTSAREQIELGTTDGTEPPKSDRELKVWQKMFRDYLEPIVTGKKTFEVFPCNILAEGSAVTLRGIDDDGEYTGCWCQCRVTYVYEGDYEDPFRLTGEAEGLSFTAHVASIEVMNFYYTDAYRTKETDQAKKELEYNILLEGNRLLWSNKPPAYNYYRPSLFDPEYKHGGEDELPKFLKNYAEELKTEVIQTTGGDPSE